VVAGVAPGLAVVVPLVIDLAVGVATVALVAVGDKPVPRPAVATVPPTAGTSPALVASGAGLARNAATTGGATSSNPEAGAMATDAATLAAQLVADKVTRQPVDTVQAILEAHERGDALNRIAADLGVHHSAVRRVLDAAHPQERAELRVAGLMRLDAGARR
jgi:hypothetical protein